MTEAIEQAATAVGGHLEGLANRVKSKESIEKKIRKLVEQQRFNELRKERRSSQGAPPSMSDLAVSEELVNIAWSTTDVLRYTIIIPIDCYTDGVKRAREMLIAECNRRRGGSKRAAGGQFQAILRGIFKNRSKYMQDSISRN